MAKAIQVLPLALKDKIYRILHFSKRLSSLRLPSETHLLQPLRLNPGSCSTCLSPSSCQVHVCWLPAASIMNMQDDSNHTAQWR